MYVEKLSSHDLTACQAEWRQLPISEIPDRVSRESKDGTDAPVWEALLNVPFSFPIEDTRIVESYASCLTCRQYEYVVRVSFGSIGSSPALIIPVVVSNCPTVAVSARTSSVASTVNTLTPYVYLSEANAPIFDDEPNASEIPSYEDVVGHSDESPPRDRKESCMCCG
jgi:hypothetical protein